MNLKNLTTSKVLTYTITVFFMICVLMVEFVQVKFGINTFSLLSYLLPLESIIILSYFGKSSLEFYQRIKSGVDIVNTTLQNQDVINNQDNIDAIQKSILPTNTNIETTNDNNDVTENNIQG